MLHFHYYRTVFAVGLFTFQESIPILQESETDLPESLCSYVDY